MFGINKLKKTVSDLQKRIIDLEHPFKFDCYAKVKVTIPEYHFESFDKVQPEQIFEGKILQRAFDYSHTYPEGGRFNRYYIYNFVEEQASWLNENDVKIEVIK